MNQAPRVRRVRNAANKYLTFDLAGERYGVPILSVREIIGLLDITPVPRMPPEVRGVINLRGKVIPVIDLRVRFGLERRPDGKRTCIIVFQFPGEGGAPPLAMGAIVDLVCEVVDLPPESIEPPPAFGAAIVADCISGVGKGGSGGRVVMLLAPAAAIGRAIPAAQSTAEPA